MPIEKRPPTQNEPSTEALAVGAEYLPAFKEYVPIHGPLTASAVEKIQEMTGLKSRQIRRLARRFKENPVAESLSPRPRGPKVGSHRISLVVREAIEELLWEQYLKLPPPSVADAADKIRNLLIADNGDYRFPAENVPSHRTIVRLIDEISSPQLARTTMGSKKRSAHEPHPASFESGGILDLVQMDHTKADVILVDSTEFEELGRPWVTFIIDVFTRCILGFYVSFGDPSIFRCGRAIVNALLPKEPLLEQLGVEVYYPMHGQFSRLHADYAKPHRAETFRRACLANGINPDVRPAGPSNYGGHIERLIGTMIGKMRVLPGATGSNATQRDGYNAGEEAAMSLPEFEKWLVYQIAAYHNRKHRGLGGRCPAEVWKEAIALAPAKALPPSLDTQHLVRQFLPSDELTISAQGVKMLYRRYWHPEMASRIGQKVTIHYDERTIQEVYLHIDGRFLVASVVGEYPDVSLHEWEATRKKLREKTNSYLADGASAATARYIQEGRKIVLDAKDRKQRKRREREGVGHGKVAESPKTVHAVQWINVDELGEDQWVKRSPNVT